MPRIVRILIRVSGSCAAGNLSSSVRFAIWLEKLDNEQAATEKFADVYALDLYKTRVRGLDGLDPASFATFVDGLDSYQAYVRERHAHPEVAPVELLESAGSLFQKVVDSGKAGSLVYSYLGSVRSLQNQALAAIAAYDRATTLDPKDEFAAHALKRLHEATALQPPSIASFTIFSPSK